MTDLIDRPVILPTTTGPVPVAMVDVDGRLDDIDTASISAVKAYDTAPTPFLPYLAWEASVDVWDPAWPEAVQRAVIEAAPTVHRYKGTVYAVTTALAALQVDSIIEEWWQTSPKGAPYTFRVRAYAQARLFDGPVLDARLTKVVFSSILRSKPDSRAFSFVIGAKFPNTLGVAAVVQAKVAQRVAMRPSLDAKATTTLGAAAVSTAKVVSRSAARPNLDARAGALMGLACVALGRTRVRAGCLIARPA